jgi:ABC-type multidrug transport system permease subunit
MATTLTKPEEQQIQTPPPPRPVLTNGRWAGYTNLLLARMAELRREPEVIFWIFLFPILLAFGLGVAFRSKPPDTISVAIEKSAGAERALDLLERSPEHARIKAAIAEGPSALDGFRLGKYALVIEPKADGSFGFRFDPMRPESVLAKTEIDNALETAAGRSNPLSITTKESSEPGARYIDFLIPGLLGMTLMNSGLWGIGFALVEMRQRKLLRRYVATPMRRSHFMLALVSSRLILMLVEVVLLISFGVLAFHMRVEGHWWQIVLIGVSGALCFSGLGLMLASRAQKIETVSGLTNLVLMPMWIFSGVFFSYDRFPQAVHPLIQALPLTALNDAFRSTILEGAPLHAQALRFVVMLAWAGVCFVLALKWFRWT